MRLSVVFELLLVFLFLAFAAARVIDKKNAVVQNAKKLRQGGPNRYCACTTNMCNCCRDFSLPVVPVKGPGCASIMYLKGDNMMISMSFGDRVLSNMTLTGPKPKPVCMTLPGGISQFCGRIYGISRTEKNFKACLGLELRALDDIEAALRVSCFKFGPKGVNLETAPPIPQDESKEPDDEDDEDDDEDDDDYDLDDEEDDDLIGLGGDLDDEDDDDDDSPNTVSENEGNEVDSDPDYTGFSVLGEDFFGTFFTDEESRPKKKKQPVRKTGKPNVLLPKVSTTTRRPILPTKRPTLRPEKATRKPVKKITLIPRPSGTKIVATTATPAPSLPPVPIQQQSVFIQPIPTLPPKKNPMTSSPVTSTTSAQKSPSTTTEKLIMTSTEQLSTASTFLPDSSSEKVSDNWYVEQHSTQGPTPVKITLPDDEVKLPYWDVQKIEAIAAIAQQGVTSSVIHSSALTPDQKAPILNDLVTEEIRTEKYVPAPTESMLKAGSRPNESEEEEEEEEDDLLDGILDGGLDSEDENTESEESDESNKVTEDESKPPTATINVNTENEKDETDISESTAKPPKVKPPEKGEEEEEDEHEESDDLLEGIIDDATDDEEEDENKKGDKEEEDEEEEEEENPKEDEEEEEDILGAFVSDPYESDNEKDESNNTVQKDKNKGSEEESDEDDDLLSVLTDDDEEEDTAAEVEDDDDKPTLKKRDKYPGSSTGNGTTPQGNKSDSSASSSSSSSDEDKSDGHKHKNKYNTTKSTTIISETAGQQGMTSQPEVTTVEEMTGHTTSDFGTVSEKGPSSQQETSTEEGTVDQKAATGIEETTAGADVGFTTAMTTEQVTDESNNEKEGFRKKPVVAVPKSDQLLMMKVATKMKEPQVLRLGDLLGPKKKYLSNDKPISTSRTHRRMNLDRWAPL